MVVVLFTVGYWWWWWLWPGLYWCVVASGVGLPFRARQPCVGVVLWGAVVDVSLVPPVLSFGLVPVASCLLRWCHGGGCVSGCGFPLLFALWLPAIRVEPPGMGSAFSWYGDGQWWWSPPFLAGGLLGWVGVLGGFLPILAGCWVFEGFVTRVWCRFCWLGELLVCANGLGVTCGMFSGVLVGGAWPGRRAVRSWRWVPVADLCWVACWWRQAAAWWWSSSCVPWVFPPWGCVTLFCVFGVWRWWFAFTLWRARRGLWVLASCTLCACFGGGLPLVRLYLSRCGVAFPVLLGCLPWSAPCSVVWLVFLVPGLPVVLRLVWGGPSSFATGCPVGVVFCCPCPGLVWVLVVLLLLVGARRPFALVVCCVSPLVGV